MNVSSERTAIVVSHTHWDREWYLPFQRFRMQLVDMVDGLLDLLSDHPRFRHFMLDGQSIILDDYVQVKPENRQELANRVRSGRISVGPWYVLPDEALVSGESLIRNLMAGERAARPFGEVMRIGYLPDTFGHINQLPQIARGWGLKAVVISRGVPADAPCEFLWDGPDGVPVLAINLRHSYSNAIDLDPSENLVSRIQDLARDLSEYATTPYLLFTNGNDHHAPEETVPEAIHHLNENIPDLKLMQGSLETFVDTVVAANPALEHRVGEMRDHEQHFILPGVLSTRIWIKQRNAANQRLLERWAEPFSAWSHGLGARDSRPFLKQAWRYLLQNHAHDSICGCSVDDVHEDMIPRFDWVEQIGTQIVRESLAAIAGATVPDDGTMTPYMAVFNPASTSRSDVVTMNVEMPIQGDGLQLYDLETERVIPLDILSREEQKRLTFSLNNRATLRLLEEITKGELVNERIRSMWVRHADGVVYLEFLVAEVGRIDEKELSAFIEDVRAWAEADEDLEFHFAIDHQPRVDVRFVAEAIPAMGYRVLKVIPAQEAHGSQPADDDRRDISNEFLEVSVDPDDGTIVLRDKISGRIFAGINRFVDGGDAGDEYNYSPPRHHDTIIRSPEDPPKIVIERSQVAESLTVRMTYRVPAGLTPDRSARSPERVDLPIETTLFLYRGIRRLDIETQVKNEAKDHRLRVHFPTGIAASEAWADTAFDVVARDTGVPDHGQDWPEKPVGTYPQQGFVDVHDHDGGLAVASDGLPEYEVLIGEEGSTIAVTLLRCVGWLSRDDLVTRSGLAGPILPTPRAQCIDVFRHRYALIPHEEGWQGVFLRAREYLAPLRCTMVWGGNPRPVSQSLVTVEPVEVVISAIKQPEDGQGLVVRVFNPLPHAVDMTMSLALPFKSGVLATLREEPDPEEHAAVEARFVSPGYFRMKLERKRIQTILFT